MQGTWCWIWYRNSVCSILWTCEDTLAYTRNPSSGNWAYWTLSLIILIQFEQRLLSRTSIWKNIFDLWRWPPRIRSGSTLWCDSCWCWNLSGTIASDPIAQSWWEISYSCWSSRWPIHLCFQKKGWKQQRWLDEIFVRQICSFYWQGKLVPKFVW